MSQTTQYNFFSDPCAYYEIHKHKWFLSEHAHREIGFATAAVDWITHYGNAWKFYRLSELFNPAQHEAKSPTS